MDELDKRTVTEMYENLIRNLRICQDGEHCDRCEFYALKMANGLNACTEALCKQAADAIEELQGQINGWIEQERKALIKSLPRWIPVTERLPEKCGEYIVYLHSFTGGTLDDDVGDWGYTTAMYFDKGQSLWTSSGTSYNAVLSAVDTGTEYHITHWMPLPSTEGLNET